MLTGAAAAVWHSFWEDLLMRRSGGVFALSLLAALAAATEAEAASQGAVPDFSAFWAKAESAEGRMFHPPASGPGPVLRTPDAGDFSIGDHTNPILKPHAAAAVKAFGDIGRAGKVELPAWSLCWPSGVPLVLNMAEPVQFLQTPDQVTILYNRDMQVRRIDLNRDHPGNMKPSWYGYSVGHYENGDTLVVDTRGQNARALIDRFGTPRSEKIRVIERYKLSADRQTIDVEFTVEDPDIFTTPWSARVSYLRNEGPITERICAENNKNPDGGEFPVPAAARADF
jgi:hypothetical protein